MHTDRGDGALRGDGLLAGLATATPFGTASRSPRPPEDAHSTAHPAAARDQAGAGSTPHAPGLLVLSNDWQIESSTRGVDPWLKDLPDGDLRAGRLPSVVLTVAGQALRSANSTQAGEVAMARVLARSGRWVVLHGAALRTGSELRVAVIVESAHPVRITGLLMSAYGLIDREQEVTRLVLRGGSTAQIAIDLVRSLHTVQQHLKSAPTRRAFGAAATSWARSSSRTTSLGCATTRSAPCSTGPSAAALPSMPHHRLPGELTTRSCPASIPPHLQRRGEVRPALQRAGARLESDETLSVVSHAPLVTAARHVADRGPGTPDTQVARHGPRAPSWLRERTRGV